MPRRIVLRGSYDVELDEAYQDVTDDDSVGEEYDSEPENQNRESGHIAPVQWARVAVGDHSLEVSSEGSVRPAGSMFNVTKGTPLPGTPYSVINLGGKVNDGEARSVLVHELVWYAFNGPPPADWEVRHTLDYVARGHRVYSNALRHLSAYRKTTAAPWEDRKAAMEPEADG